MRPRRHNALKRRHFYLLTLVFLGGLVALDLALLLRPDKLRALLQQEIRENLKVPVEYVDLDFQSLGTIRVSGITLRRGYHTSEPVFFCKELIADLDWATLLRGDVKVESIEIVEPTLYLKWNENGELDIPSVLKSTDTKPRAASIPAIDIRDMKVAFENAPFWNEDADVVLRGIGLELVPRRSKVFPYEFNGTIDDDVFGHLVVHGAFGDAQFRGRMERRGFTLEPQHVACLESGARDILSNVRMWGSMDLVVELSSEELLDNVDIRVTAQCNDVGLEHTDYPTRVEDLRGELELHHGRVESELLDFRLADAYVSVSEGFVDLRKPSPEFEVRGKMSRLYVNDELADGLGAYPEPFPDVREVLKALQVDGYVDADFEIVRKEPYDRVLIDFVVSLLETNFNYLGFYDDEGQRESYLYPLENIIGTVRIGNDGLTFHDLRSKTKTPDITARGEVHYGRSPFSFDLDIRGRSIEIDDKVRTALPESSRAVLDDFRPSGAFDFRLDIGRREDEETTDVRMDVRLEGATVLPAVFPYELHDVRGGLVFGGEAGTRVQGLTAQHGHARIGVDGLVDLIDDGGGGGGFRLDITATDLSVDDELLAGVAREFPEAAAEIRRFNFEGQIDFGCHIEAGTYGTEHRFDVLMKGLSFRYDGFPEAHFTDLEGRIAAVGDRLDIESASMTCVGNRFDATGWVDLGSEVTSHEVTLRCDDFRLHEEAMELAAHASPAVARLSELFDVSGRVGLKLRSKKTRRGELFHTNVAVHGAALMGKTTTLSVQDIHGQLFVDGDTMEMSSWTGVVPFSPTPAGADNNLVLNLKRGVYRDRGGDKRQLVLSGIGFQNLSFEERLFELLPASIAEDVRELKLAGRVDGLIDTFRLRGGRGVLKGQLRPRGVTLEPGMRMSLEDGVVVIDNGVIEDGGFRLQGRVRDGRIRLHAFELTDVDARFALDRDALAVREITGRTLDGVVNKKRTYYLMDFDDSGRFDASLSLTGASLSRFIQRLGGNPKSLDGTANAWARVTGDIRDQKTWQGGGSVRMKGRRLYDLPFFAVVLEILNFDFLTSPRDSVQAGAVEATIAQSRVNIDEASFRGPGINLDGRGYIGFDGICNLTFDPKALKLIDQIPIVSDIIDLATGFVVSAVRVTGPIEDPEAKADNYITEILPGKEDTGRRLKVRPLKNDDGKKDDERR